MLSVRERELRILGRQELQLRRGLLPADRRDEESELQEQGRSVLDELGLQGDEKVLQESQRSVSSSEAALLTFHLESMGSELQLLQSSEKQLLGLMDELHQEAHFATRKANDLETRFCQESHLNAKHRKELEYQLQGKLYELQEMQKAHHALQQELSEQNSAHQRTVQELQRENTNSVDKLREMAEQFEWLCGQQRNWICCIKRFKDCLNDEKETLVLQVNRLQDELSEFKKNKSEMISEKDTQPTMHCIRWDVDGTSDLQVEEDEWRAKYQNLVNRFSSCQQLDDDEYLKPP
ncbi:uncharacterized protein LOC134336041 [Trichomycterus rosablanca]|uniref:uncharacterized protein LOC134336041 n=1 Tax=Trichomycterus rosablanca TaxID=2290929 RepID=UPI002F354EA4